MSPDPDQEQAMPPQTTDTGAAAPTPAPAPVRAPSVHVRAVITWLAIYPTVTLAMALLGDVTARLPLPVRTLILTVVVVPVAVYGVVPALVRLHARVTRR
jgi:antibiotic biosynthesis monooxygenase (ABM) superfamily enzyme